MFVINDLVCNVSQTHLSSPTLQHASSRRKTSRHRAFIPSFDIHGATQETMQHHRAWMVRKQPSRYKGSKKSASTPTQPICESHVNGNPLSL